MTNVVKFSSVKPAPEKPSGPYWAGQPMKEAFPRKRIRTTEEMQRRTLVMHEGTLCYIDDDEPEGAA